MNPALTSSKRMDWQTPESFLELVRRMGPIALDPCTTPENPTGAAVWCFPDATPPAVAAAAAWHDPHIDGLSARWSEMSSLAASNGYGRLVYVNPPYGRKLPKWIDKCVAEAKDGAEIVALVPARTDTKWGQLALESCTAALLWRGRIRFVDAATGVAGEAAAFPSAVFYWGGRELVFRKAFAGRGLFVRVG